MPLRRALVVLLPLLVLTAGLSAIDIFDGTIGIGGLGRVEAGIVVFAVAAVVGRVLTREMPPRHRE